jgi:hypothetical protein
MLKSQKEVARQSAASVRDSKRLTIWKRVAAFPLRLVWANSSSCFSLIDVVDLDAPLSLLFEVSPRLAARRRRRPFVVRRTWLAFGVSSSHVATNVRGRLWVAEVCVLIRNCAAQIHIAAVRRKTCASADLTSAFLSGRSGTPSEMASYSRKRTLQYWKKTRVSVTWSKQSWSPRSRKDHAAMWWEASRPALRP